MSRNDVAIYGPESADWYESGGGRGGGAERQMMLLARALSSRAVRVAHIVFRPRDPVPLQPHLTLVYREDDEVKQSLIRGLAEAATIWRSLSAADASVAIVRAATPAVGVAALHCRLHRRRLMYSSANDSDFMASWLPEPSFSRTLYRLGLRLADVLIVQSEDQLKLARERYGEQREVIHIPSFCEPPEAVDVDASRAGGFVWIGRLRPEKRPLRYVELARALPEERFAMVPIVLGAEAAYRELREAAAGVENLELLERLPHAQLMAIIARSAGVVSTSAVEGMPNVFLEAWARGIPVLTLDCDPDGVIARRQLGIAASGSWDRFVAGARELSNGRVDRGDLARRARAYIDEVHSVAAVGARWAEVIRSLGGTDDRRATR
jgi:glycosyltransferase involved in cell wall biosynthesis